MPAFRDRTFSTSISEKGAAGWQGPRAGRQGPPGPTRGRADYRVMMTGLQRLRRQGRGFARRAAGPVGAGSFPPWFRGSRGSDALGGPDKTGVCGGVMLPFALLYLSPPRSTMRARRGPPPSARGSITVADRRGAWDAVLDHAGTPVRGGDTAGPDRGKHPVAAWRGGVDADGRCRNQVRGGCC